MVVTFGVQASPGWCDVNPCPLGCFGPYETADQAQAVAEAMYSWQQPHVLSLQAPDRAVLRSDHEFEE